MTADLRLLCGDFRNWSELAGYPLQRPFSADAIALLDSLSRHLVSDPATRQQADLVALAFWLRRANLESLAEQLSPKAASSVFVARGTVFHIAPSNVASIAIYSWSLGLLTGNRNVVRISSRAGEQSHLLVRALHEVMRLARFSRFRATNIFVSYPSDSEMTASISQIADARVIWGGDQSIAEIRAVPLPAASTELTFADRHSLAVIGASGWLAFSDADREERTRRFLNDTLSFGQMACSSARKIYWLGNAGEVDAARADFWQRVAHLRPSPRPRSPMQIRWRSWSRSTPWPYSSVDNWKSRTYQTWCGCGRVMLSCLSLITVAADFILKDGWPAWQTLGRGWTAKCRPCATPVWPRVKFSISCRPAPPAARTG